MRNVSVAAAVGLVLLQVAIGCDHKTESPAPAAAPASQPLATKGTTHTSLIDDTAKGESNFKFQAEHVAAPGETLTWKIGPNETRSFTIQFDDSSVCTASSSGLTLGPNQRTVSCTLSATFSGVAGYKILLNGTKHPRDEKASKGKTGSANTAADPANPHCNGCYVDVESSSTQ